MRIQYRDLEELGRRFGKIDLLIVHLLALRREIVRQVGRIKRARGLPIRRPDIEERRLAEAREYAERFGADQDLIAKVLRLIIEQSCEDQEAMMAEPAEPEIVDDKLWHKGLRKNLLQLTSVVASVYEESYGGVATKAYREFEWRMIERSIRDLSSHDVALDLGCASGPQTRGIARYFSHVIGLDLSSAMVEEARKRSDSPKTEFLMHDLEQGLPFEDESASFVLMNMGTASDIVHLPELLVEIRRVLVPEGAAFLSFYNEEALFYELGVPYYPGLSAEFNEMRHTLDVRFGKEIYRIFARPYTLPEIRILLKGAGLRVKKNRFWSHPTISSLIPDIPYEGKGLRRMEEADEALATRCMSGAYIIVVAEKN